MEKNSFKDQVTIEIKLTHESASKSVQGSISLTAFDAMRDLHNIEPTTEIITELRKELYKECKYWHPYDE